MRRALRLAAHPSRVLELAEIGAQAAREVGRLALFNSKPETTLLGELGVSKRAAWSAAMSLDGAKMVARRLGGTVNDVFLAAVSGALRRYLLARGEVVEELEIGTGIPVSLRSPGTEAALGNRVGAVLLLLPVRLADPVERLRVIGQRMDLHKSSLQARLLSAGLGGLGALPAGAASPLVDHFTSGLTAVTTNVIGPRERLVLADAPVEAFMAWVPRTGKVGLGVSFLSYAGEVRVGVISDEGLVPDPEAIVAGFQAEFDALLAQAERVGETASLRDSLSRLDQALVTLEAVLDGRREGVTQAAEEVRHSQAPPR